MTCGWPVTLAVVVFIPTVPRLVDRAVGRRGKEHWQAYRDFNAEFVDELLAAGGTFAGLVAAQRDGSLER